MFDLFEIDALDTLNPCWGVSEIPYIVKNVIYRLTGWFVNEKYIVRP
jgi:hypothetical protein